MAQVRVLILRAAGINCDLETQHAWELVGAQVDRIHVRALAEQPQKLAEYAILTVPGGFSYGDDIAAGRILAAQLKRHLGDALRQFVDRGGLVLGICNGFQVLVQTGLLPFPDSRRRCTIAPNDPPGFQDRWVTLRAEVEHCAFLERGREYALPIAHGEGRVLFSDDDVAQRILTQRHAALRYIPGKNGSRPDAPYNPNGSTADIAGLCDETGRVLGIMPHPERHVTALQHPAWTSRNPNAEGDGLAFFQRAVANLR